MFAGMLRELRYLQRHKADLFMAVIAPLLVIVLFASMFSSGKADHLPIAIIDQDQSEMSRKVIHALSINHTLKVKTITASQDEAERLVNSTDVWGFILIPDGAEQRLVKAQDAQISIAYNQSFFSIGNTISSAMLISTLNGMADYMGESYLSNNIPYLDMPTPHIKISTLYNPSMSYELFLEPFMVPAVLHLLLCCCVTFRPQRLFIITDCFSFVNNFFKFILTFFNVVSFVFLSFPTAKIILPDVSPNVNSFFKFFVEVFISSSVVVFLNWAAFLTTSSVKVGLFLLPRKGTGAM